VLKQIELGYAPRSAFIPFHTRKDRFSCIVAHRRAGKTVAAITDLIDAALRCTKPDPRFAYIAPYYAQAKDVVWAYLKRFTAAIPNASINESELRVDLPNGGGSGSTALTTMTACGASTSTAWCWTSSRTWTRALGQK
jgi:phage terminase large subunit